MKCPRMIVKTASANMKSLPSIKTPTIKTPKSISLKPSTNVGINYKAKSIKSVVPSISIDSGKIIRKDKVEI